MRVDFCWDQPIRSMADGEVAQVVDDVPDNLGNRENPANTPKRNSRIVVRHGSDRFAIYTHPRQGSAAVKVGQQVKAGDLLGRVGNAGFSSEPHLHVAGYTLDRTGRVRALPLTFSDLRAPDGAAVPGVPKGGLQYVSP